MGTKKLSISLLLLDKKLNSEILGLIGEIVGILGTSEQWR